MGFLFRESFRESFSFCGVLDLKIKALTEPSRPVKLWLGQECSQHLSKGWVNLTSN
jgi:hypothetical protein